MKIEVSALILIILPENAQAHGIGKTELCSIRNIPNELLLRHRRAVVNVGRNEENLASQLATSTIAQFLTQSLIHGIHISTSETLSAVFAFLKVNLAITDVIGFDYTALAKLIHVNKVANLDKFPHGHFLNDLLSFLILALIKQITQIGHTQVRHRLVIDVCQPPNLVDVTCRIGCLKSQINGLEPQEIPSQFGQIGLLEASQHKTRNLLVFHRILDGPNGLLVLDNKSRTNRPIKQITNKLVLVLRIQVFHCIQ